MAEATIRLGKISSINYSAGKARVTYEDRDGSVTSELPFLAWQYNMPKISDLVVVACFANGSVSGVILGPVFGAANVPYEAASGVFRQEMTNVKNEVVMTYNSKTKKLQLRAPYIEFEGYDYEDKPVISLEQLSDALADIEDNKQHIADIDDEISWKESKGSIQDQLDKLDKRITALGG